MDGKILKLSWHLKTTKQQLMEQHVSVSHVQLGLPLKTLCCCNNNNWNLKKIQINTCQKFRQTFPFMFFSIFIILNIKHLYWRHLNYMYQIV